MCAQHHHAQHDGHTSRHRPATPCCANPTHLPTQHSAHQCDDQAPSCCDHSTHEHTHAQGETLSPDDDEEGDRPPSSAYQNRWHVQGMDCPSCAQKIETAVQRLPGVTRAEVRFTTEKLIVDYEDQALSEHIEKAVTQAGFTLARQANASDQARHPGQARHSDQIAHSNPNHSKSYLFWQANRHWLLIALGSAIAFILSPWHPQVSQYLFIVTCLLGLLPIARHAWQLMRSGTPFAIETLMTVAALGALYLGETAEASTVLLLFLIGERLEGVAAARARSGVQALMALVPDQAVKIEQGQRITVPASTLIPGDLVEVSPGGRLPADGQLNDEAASFDESALTGESIPVERFQGERLPAGAVAVDRVVRLTITSEPGDNAIDRILQLIEDAESRKAPLERFLAKFSRWYTPLMMALALAVVLIPPLMFAQPWDTWIYRGLAMLLIACPCALVISTPAAITSGLAAGTRLGALIKGGAALEQLGRIDTIAIDKTGTLTEGKPQVTEVHPLAHLSTAQVLQYAAAIETGSSHPLAKALIHYATEQLATPWPEAEHKQALAGRGVSGEIKGQTYQLLAPAQLSEPLTDEVSAQVETLESQGKTLGILLEAQTPVGLIAWQDTLRSDALEAVQHLHEKGIRVVMLTGDNARSAAAISQRLGIDYQAELLPTDKVRYVEQLAHSHQVAMVGDGINDAPAMKAAHIGIAMGSGSDVALEAADAAITHNRLPTLSHMIELSQATLNNIRQNIALALGLKAVFLVTSLIGITGLWVAVLADSGATALVTLNALRLLRHKARQ
ncbi:zinc/cadmium/mercury/lead-transporting ATPase [Terasakiispira papahanaumokuakeensis]|uniref:P-type Zn(2+) transporter n=1 Tax=Terasakiispira papahanaumokuakeensis TaxID=197479 RepID=A0A1E2VAS2_9GAMM|nr:zinc/cadmium/mercury/lead-transporting ATPase [Terasakiispira papahanaumokuakeensis]ODC04071.1 zinc/cadmium/mercury/lead-transporting ATPase [Terasakiispira papahanaumokuakeensis]